MSIKMLSYVGSPVQKRAFIHLILYNFIAWDDKFNKLNFTWKQ